MWLQFNEGDGLLVLHSLHAACWVSSSLSVQWCGSRQAAVGGADMLLALVSLHAAGNQVSCRWSPTGCGCNNTVLSCLQQVHLLAVITRQVTAQQQQHALCLAAYAT